jgi:hypothetical protein
MGLLDIWQDWRKESGYGRDDLTTAGGGGGGNEKKEKWHQGIFWNKGKKPSKDVTIMDSPEGTGYIDDSPEGKGKRILPSQPKYPTNQTVAKTPNLYKDKIMQGGVGTKQGEDPSWWQGLANKFNSKFDMDSAVASWKDKGGFEGLMSNPAFTMGLAFMQSGAEGKTLGQGALDNIMKAGGISSHYKQILEDRKEAPIEVTATDVGEVKSLLDSMNISSPSNVEKFFGFLGGKKNMQMKWDLASEEIAVELQKEIKKLKKNKKPGAPEVVYDTTKKLQIMKRMFNEGRFKKKGGTWFTDATLQTTQEIPKFDNKAKGGPIQAGKPYVVGEEGPEIIIPHSSGNVLSNDDSQIYAMLLAANPQLQKVSKTRAESILRSRFPEYFE